MQVPRVMLVFFLAGIYLAIPGCSMTISDIPFLPKWDSAQTGEPATPRASASTQLTNEGRQLLESGKVDDAISMLERSVGLDPANGQNYYYLSEAWLRKGNVVQAEEFNRLAELYLKDNRDWISRIREQQTRINEYKGRPRD